MGTGWHSCSCIGLIYTLKVYIVDADVVHLEVKKGKSEEADCLGPSVQISITKKKHRGCRLTVGIEVCDQTERVIGFN